MNRKFKDGQRVFFMQYNEIHQGTIRNLERIEKPSSKSPIFIYKLKGSEYEHDEREFHASPRDLVENLIDVFNKN